MGAGNAWRRAARYAAFPIGSPVASNRADWIGDGNNESVVRQRVRERVLPLVGVLTLVTFSCFGCGTSGSPPATTRSTTTTLSLGTTSTLTSACTTGQLEGSVVFNATGTDLGAIKISNTSGSACSLDGRPDVTVLNAQGTALALNEVPFQRAGLPVTHGPVDLSPGSAPPQAIVELDWTWCGPAPGNLEFQVRFAGWSTPLVIPSPDVLPIGFVPAGCGISGGTALFAVDYVRGFGSNGISG